MFSIVKYTKFMFLFVTDRQYIYEGWSSAIAEMAKNIKT